MNRIPGLTGTEIKMSDAIQQESHKLPVNLDHTDIKLHPPEIFRDACSVQALLF